MVLAHFQWMKFPPAAREGLREKAQIEEPLDEAAIAEARRREEEAEEARREAARAAGTPVTAETYAAWWERFSAEQGLDPAQCVRRACAAACVSV